MVRAAFVANFENSHHICYCERLLLQFAGRIGLFAQLYGRVDDGATVKIEFYANAHNYNRRRHSPLLIQPAHCFSFSFSFFLTASATLLPPLPPPPPLPLPTDLRVCMTRVLQSLQQQLIRTTKKNNQHPMCGNVQYWKPFGKSQAVSALTGSQSVYRWWCKRNSS